MIRVGTAGTWLSTRATSPRPPWQGGRRAHGPRLGGARLCVPVPTFSERPATEFSRSRVRNQVTRERRTLATTHQSRTLISPRSRQMAAPCHEELSPHLSKFGLEAVSQRSHTVPDVAVTTGRSPPLHLTAWAGRGQSGDRGVPASTRRASPVAQRNCNTLVSGIP